MINQFVATSKPYPEAPGPQTLNPKPTSALSRCIYTHHMGDTVDGRNLILPGP